MSQFLQVENERKLLEDAFKYLIKVIGPIPIASEKTMPFGWRKAAKGRTVWRIIEEVISQNLEKNSTVLGFKNVIPAESEVGIYDFEFKYSNLSTAYVNIKSSVKGGKKNKDDISKAVNIQSFYNENPNANLYIATFVIEFNKNMTVTISDCIVFPITWIPDIYINPSNNGNLQSSEYKNLDKAVKRSNQDFLIEFNKEFEIAQEKKRKKGRK